MRDAQFVGEFLLRAEVADRLRSGHFADTYIAVPISPQYPRSDTVPMDNDYMAKDALGVRLRHARKARGLTQQELAKSSKVPQSAISEIETGESKSPVGTNLVALAQTLQVSPLWLAQGEGAMDEPSSPLPSDAVAMAREWLKLGPEARQDVLRLIRTMVKTSAADRPHAADERVADAYGKPGTKKVKTTG